MPLENMTDHEILVELLKEKRLRDRLRYVKIAAIVVVLIAVVVFAVKFVVPVSNYTKEINQSMTRIEAEVESVKLQAEDTMKSINDKLSEVDMESVKSFTEKLKGIDFDAIEGVIEKLGNLVNKFPILFQ